MIYNSSPNKERHRLQNLIGNLHFNCDTACIFGDPAAGNKPFPGDGGVLPIFTNTPVGLA